MCKAGDVEIDVDNVRRGIPRHPRRPRSRRKQRVLSDRKLCSTGGTTRAEFPPPPRAVVIDGRPEGRRDARTPKPGGSLDRAGEGEASGPAQSTSSKKRGSSATLGSITDAV